MPVGKQWQWSYQEGIKNSLQLEGTVLCRMIECKITNLKGGYSSNESLIFQSCSKDIKVHILHRRLTQSEAIQLVQDFTSDHTQSEVEYYLVLYLEEEQSFWGWLITWQQHFSLANGNSLIGHFTIESKWQGSQRMHSLKKMQIQVHKIVARKQGFRRETNETLNTSMTTTCGTSSSRLLLTIICSVPPWYTVLWTDVLC